MAISTTNGTLALASGSFSTLNPSQPKTDVLSAATRNGVETITSPISRFSNATLSNLNFAGNEGASKFVLSSSNNLVVTGSKYNFAGGNDTLVISSSKAGSSLGNVATNSEFDLGAGIDKITFAGGVGNIIVNSGIGDDAVQVSGNTTSSNFLLGEGNDQISFVGSVTSATVDGGAGKDTMIFSGAVSNSNINGGAGADTITFSKAVTGGTVSGGADNDAIRFNSTVGATSIELGAGKDLLIFGGAINAGTNVNLGMDGAIDTIQIARGVSYTGLKITGANTGDILVIGSSTYTFTQNSGEWINALRPSDKRTF